MSDDKKAGYTATEIANARTDLMLKLHTAGRLVAGHLPGNHSVPPMAVAEALDNNIEALRAVVESHDKLRAMDPKKDPRHG